MKEKLSISIVAYHDEQDILRAMDTLEEYTPDTISRKICIIDNGSGFSKHGKQESFRKNLKKYADVDYIDAKKNIGFGRAHNLVLKDLDSQYHCIMNPDIEFTQDAFTPILSYLDQHPEVGMVIPDLREADGDRQYAYRKDPTVWDMFIRMFCKDLFPQRVKEHALQDMDYTRPFQVPFGQGSFLVIRTDLFKELGGFDENFFLYLEDADLCRRVNRVSRLMYIPDAQVTHKWKKGSHKNPVLLMHHLHSMGYYFNKWGWKWH